MCCTRLAQNTGRKKIAKNLPSAHHCTTLSGYIFTTKARIDNRKNLLKSNISSTCSHNMVNSGPLTAEIGSCVWALQQISTTFASWLRTHSTDAAQRRSPMTPKLYTMFGRLLGWYTIYTFLGALGPLLNSARCEIHFASKFCVL